jgi:spermidine synthase
MTSESDFSRPDGTSGGGWTLPVLMVLFAGSGCAALIYEIVWFQLLQLVIGSSAVSLGVLLGTYMGGLCLGSLLAPRLVQARHNPVRLYALMEAGIGALGLVVLFALPAVERFYVSRAGLGGGGILLRGLVCGLCLLPPTLLMGATLPVVSRWVRATPRGVAWLGFLYGGNIAGAVVGCLVAGFYLLRVHDMVVATFSAAALNAAVALVALGLSTEPDVIAGRQARDSDLDPAPSAEAVVLLAIGLSGFSALGAEVVWTRLLSLLLGGTVYTFSIILAVFLVGLGAGSALGSFLSGSTRRPRLTLGICQTLLLPALAWTAFMLAKSLPYWPVNPSLSRSPWLNFQLDLVRGFWAVLPPTILWGASFPLALRAAAAPGQDPGRLVGRVYGLNTIGAIVGALGTSLFLIGRIGTQRTQQALIGASALAAIVLFAWLIYEPDPPAPRAQHGDPSLSSRRPLERAAGNVNRRVAGMLLAMAAALGILLIRTVPSIPWQLVAHGRYLPTFPDDRKMLYLGEGLNASVAVTEMSNGVRNFHISGKVEASTDPRDMRMQRMLGHLPALFHPRLRWVLVVGCGAGVTAGCFVDYPEVESIVICELEPLIPRDVTPLFAKQNENVLQDRRVRVVCDDARHYLLTTKERFDVITSDPIHPWVRGAASLYTLEFYELCRRHLNPGGLITQWVPLYESDPAVVKSELATFFDAFPGGTIWANDDNGQGYDTLALGGMAPLQINLDDLQARLMENPAAGRSLGAVGFYSGIALLSTYAGQDADLRPWLARAQINRDVNLRLQYLAGLTANRYDEAGIYEQMLYYRRYPEKLFAGSEEDLRALRLALKMPKPGQ